MSDDRVRLTEAEREALRGEVEHWKAHAEEAGRGFAEVCKNYARVSARNVELVRRIEELTVQLAAARSALAAVREVRQAQVEREGR